MSSDRREILIAAAKYFYDRGWMMGTAGNLSTCLPDGSLWITASGRSKGQLTPMDFIRIDRDGNILEHPNPDLHPSAETSIHLAIYNCFPEAKACYHVHSIEGQLISRFGEGDTLPLPASEMLKGLGVWEENPKVEMPLFCNYLDVGRIASEISDRFQISPPQVPALLIRDHGVTVWAESPAVAYNYVEIVEFIFRYMVVARQVSI